MPTNIVRLYFCAALAASLVSCAKPEKEAETIAPVQVASAAQGTIHELITADAILYPRDQANVMPKISAPVRRFLVKRGDHVKQGQLLAELENRDLVAAAAESRGQLGQAESNLRSTSVGSVPEQTAKAQTDVDAARQGLDAAQKLLESRQQLFMQGALARRQVDEAQVAYAQAKSAADAAQQHLKALQDVGRDELIKTATAQVEAAKGHFDTTQAQVDYSEIRSPISGVVTDRPAYAGEIANPGTSVVTVMDMSTVVARVNLTQDQAKDIKVGAAATLTPADGTDAVKGKVTIVSPAVDSNSTTVQVWAEANNPGERLRAGTSVHVEIVAATIKDAVLVPASAILPGDEGGTMVLVVDGKDTAHHRKVSVGAREPPQVQISSGVAAGDRVVVLGGLGLDDNAKVRVTKAGEPADADDKKDDDKKDDEGKK